MENTPTGHADDLPTISGIFKNDPTSRSVNILFSGRILTQSVLKNVLPAKAPPSYLCMGCRIKYIKEVPATNTPPTQMEGSKC